jgi:hypothetical protein
MGAPISVLLFVLGAVLLGSPGAGPSATLDLESVSLGLGGTFQNLTLNPRSANRSTSAVGTAGERPRILYASNWTARMQIYAVDPSGRAAVAQLTFGSDARCSADVRPGAPGLLPDGFVQPVPSPNGRYVLTGASISPRTRRSGWLAPTDERLAASRPRAGPRRGRPTRRASSNSAADGLHGVRPDGSGDHILTRMTSAAFALSPDGKTIATVGPHLSLVRGGRPTLLRRDAGFEVACRPTGAGSRRGPRVTKGPHSKIISATPGLEEYRQIHLAEVNPGLWPATPGVETEIPAERRIDGVAEVTFQSLLSPLLGRKQTQLAFKDEIKVFRRTLLYAGLPNSSRWYEMAEPGEKAGARALIYLRRKDGVGAGDFRKLINKELVPALAGTGMLRELRTQSFLPWNERLWDTPNVAHYNPADQRFHASLVLGFTDAQERAGFLRGREMESLSDMLAPLASAIHAYDVSAALPYVEDGRLAAAARLDQGPNHRCRRVEPNASFSAASSGDGPTRRAVGFGPPRKFASTLPTAPPPNSM